MLSKVFHMLIVRLLVLFVIILPTGQCGPEPNVNNNDVILSAVPQTHCLRYFKRDLLRMRRCRHLRVPSTSLNKLISPRS